MTLQKFEPPEHRSDLFRLPSGDWINIFTVEAARMSMKANRTTGEVGGIAYINSGGSWYSVPFEHADDAHAFVDALVEHRNELHRPRRETAALSRQDAAMLLADLEPIHDDKVDEQ